MARKFTAAGDVTYRGTYNGTGDYANSENADEKVATAYSAEFTGLDAAKKYSGATVAWKIDYNATANETGTTTKIFDVNDITGKASDSYGLVITGKGLTENEATVSAKLIASSVE